MPLLSLRAYAKHRGVSLAAVQKAIHSGRITPNSDGLIDSDRADAEWAAKTRPRQHRARLAPSAVREPAEAGGAGGLDYFRARAIRELVSDAQLGVGDEQRGGLVALGEGDDLPMGLERWRHRTPPVRLRARCARAGSPALMIGPNAPARR